MTEGRPAAEASRASIGLAVAIDQRYRALVPLGTFASLQWAESAALRPRDIDLEFCTIRVERQLIEQLGGGSGLWAA